MENPMTPQVAALRIGTNLQATEDRVDQALAEVGKLLVTLTEARIETASPLHIGHRAVTRLTDAAGKLGAVRSDLVRIHADMLKLAEERGDMLVGCPSASDKPGDMQVVA